MSKKTSKIRDGFYFEGRKVKKYMGSALAACDEQACQTGKNA